jgi:Xaa-Pro aminopeptidase
MGTALALSQAVERLAALRSEMVRLGGAGVVVPMADEHGSEYVPDDAQRIRWLTGFTGTAATVAVLQSHAALFTDGRYAVQARAETDNDLLEIGVSPGANLARWLSAHAPQDACVFYDPWLVSRAWVRAARAQLRADVRLEPSPQDLVDAIWADRPQPSMRRGEIHGLARAGVSSADKLGGIAQELRAQGLDAVVLAALDSVAWAFNIRGRDVPHVPVVRAFAVLRADGSATLFVDPDKIDSAMKDHLGPRVDIRPYAAFAGGLSSLRGLRVAADPDICADAIFTALADSTVVEASDPCLLPRALKNDVEIAGARAAHLRDAVALATFLEWLEGRLKIGSVDEIEAAQELHRRREATGRLRDTSFATISATGPNSALPHYVPKPGSARVIERGSLYLIDAGAQYDDGTTDVTRTIAIGPPTESMRRRFTQALRGHIAIADASFPAGTTGAQLDPLARQFLWRGGVDYATGTGHGVGSFLSVHEGPAFIGKRGGTRPIDEPLRPRMVLSIEPGYYLPGSWGLRTENLYLVVDRAGEDGTPGWFGFEALTLAPIDRALIDVGVLGPSERAWIDRYHECVLRELTPHLEPGTATWLSRACRPLGSPAK